MEQPAWQVIRDSRSVMLAPCARRHTECQAMSELEKLTLFFLQWSVLLISSIPEFNF